ncbi:MAG: NADH dehydrogenase (quinone) subunit G [Chloroflexota bacterium]
MPKITVDGIEIEAPAGVVVVDAAKRAGIDIPVFCYHPKLRPVGMCRMCLVEIGTPKRGPDGQVQLDEQGRPVIAWMPKLQTACTTVVSEGMAVRTNTEQVKRAQKDILEFLLTSHPLDCPICDKGGECPLQDLTMRYGPGKSRFIVDDKYHLAKRVPLGELIVLDRERCIQCARCTRFCDEIVDDHVLGFYDRGRGMEIITFSEPGFDSKFSGNTTDICPVGALTTRDFRFRSRPWELTNVATLCPHCPVGCNMALSTRSGQIRRVMPRQNERVNEIWICDKGRFAYHFVDHPDRLRMPLIRVGAGARPAERADGRGDFRPATWDEALDLVARKLREAGPRAAGLAGDHLPNEDLYLFQKLFRQALGSLNLDQWPGRMAGGELVAQVGLASGSNFSDMGKGTAIIVIASDLEEEAPIWWLRVKQAADRGATLLVAAGRPTKTDRYAEHKLRYRYGGETYVLLGLIGALLRRGAQATDFIQTRVDGFDDLRRRLEEYPLERCAEVSGVPVAGLTLAAEALASAQNLVILVGSEGLNQTASAAVAQAAANLLLLTGHVGQPNNGLIMVWPHNNTQGAWDMGLRPNLGPGYQPLGGAGLGYEAMLNASLSGELQALFILGADPVGADPAATEVLRRVPFLVVQELFPTETAKLADVILPVQSFAEREGTFTSGERRVQRFYPAVPPPGQSKPDWWIIAELGRRITGDAEAWRFIAPSQIMRQITRDVPLYASMTYAALAQVEPQYPDVGGEDLYYGGTAYQNTAGLGVQWPVVAERPEARLAFGWIDPLMLPTFHEDRPFTLVPVTRLFDAGIMTASAELLRRARIAEPHVELNPRDAAALNVADGDRVIVRLWEQELHLKAWVNSQAAPGIVLLPRGLEGVPDVPGITSVDILTEDGRRKTEASVPHPSSSVG